MGVLNPNDLAFNGEEVRALNEAVFEAVFAKPELSLFHNVINGIKATKQIAILGRIQGLTGKGTGKCDPDEDDFKIAMSEKTWDPKTISNNLPSCWTDLLETFFIYGTQNGIAKADLTKTDFFNFLLERMTDAVIEEVFRIIWFSDVDAATTSDSPAGVITSGTNLGYFNRINGLWKQAFAIVAATPARRTLGFDARNGQATAILQQFDNADVVARVATKTLQNVRFDSDYRMRSEERLIVCTQSVADQYEKELIDAETPYTSERLENGIMVLKIGGITIFGFQFWDRIIEEFYAAPTTKLFLPHRAIMLVKMNTQVGTEDEANFSQFNVFYDQKSEKNYIRTKYDIDAKIVQDYLVQLAY